MKKFSLMLFCGIILLGVSGCGNKIKGTYYGEKIEGLEYEDNCIKLFDNGKCSFKVINRESITCVYGTNDNEIIIEYDYFSNIINRYSETSTCILSGNKLECDDGTIEGIYIKK